MSKRKWTNIKEKEPQIIAMREAGMTRQEIADQLGLKKEQIKWWVNRYNRRQAAFRWSQSESRPKGRPRKDQCHDAGVKRHNYSGLEDLKLSHKQDKTTLPKL